ncbi:MAG: hypothetical protein V4676_07045 [Bacteroidota bacterium]
MVSETDQLRSIQDIKQMMEKSSRFISLSGLSGVAAGVCALIAAWFGCEKIAAYQQGRITTDTVIRDANDGLRTAYDNLEQQLILIAAVTFFAAFILAFLFTWLRSRKTGVPVWGFTARRVMINVLIPMIAGGLFIWRIKELNAYSLIAPASLIFYGLALINASRYTLPEIRFLGFGQLILGLINLWMPGEGLYFWAAGFGLLHIIYGIVMWQKYERNNN